MAYKRPPIPRPPADFNPAQPDMLDKFALALHTVEATYHSLTRSEKRKVGSDLAAARDKILEARWRHKYGK